METESDREFNAEVQKAWWVPLVQGITAVLFGFYALLRPGNTLALFMFFIGIYWTINGGFTIANALRSGSGSSRTWQLISGVMLIIVGLIAIFYPKESSQSITTFIAAIVGLIAIFGGASQMVMGRASVEGTGMKWTWNSFFFGLLNLVFGILVLSAPYFSYTVFIQIIAFWGILAGGVLIYLAFKMRSTFDG